VRGKVVRFSLTDPTHEAKHDLALVSGDFMGAVTADLRAVEAIGVASEDLSLAFARAVPRTATARSDDQSGPRMPNAERIFQLLAE
jgi:hypothetical protein